MKWRRFSAAWTISNNPFSISSNAQIPRSSGICSTGVTETKGDDVDGYLKSMRQRRPELADLGIVYVSTPDFQGRIPGRLRQDRYEDHRGVCSRYEESPQRAPARVNVLAGCHLTPGDIDELRDIIECFGLEPTFLPDLSGSLDGHIPEDFTPTTLGGVTKAAIARMGTAGWTLAIGEQMRDAAVAFGGAGRRSFRSVRPLDWPWR